MIAVGSYAARSDAADLAQMLLWAAGIPYVVEAAGGVRLLVEQSDAVDARSVLT